MTAGAEGFEPSVRSVNPVLDQLSCTPTSSRFLRESNPRYRPGKPTCCHCTKKPCVPPPGYDPGPVVPQTTALPIELRKV